MIISESNGSHLFLHPFVENNYNTVVVLGGQFGDEGKGKISHFLSRDADIVVRSQGGNNAGHTIVFDNKEFKLHLVPCGILEPHCQCYITGGVVLDPKVMLEEIQGLERQGIVTRDRLWISPSAHVILPYHIALDKIAEEAKGANKIGTTCRGIGPCYTDKTNRVGIRVAELMDPVALRKKLETRIGAINAQHQTKFDVEEMFQQAMGWANHLRPYVKENLELLLNDQIEAGKCVTFEGAQGAFLDVTFGTVPYVTSSSTIASGLTGGAAVGPTKIKNVLNVIKAYMTRVGEGPMPTEESDLIDNVTAREIGTTTGRPRRKGHFDAPLVRTSNKVNGVTAMAITKLDILDQKERIKICVAYTLGDKKIEEFPLGSTEISSLVPVYEVMEGWKCDTTKIRHYEDLPENAKAYLARIEELCHAKICLVSVGPDREATINVNAPVANES